MEIQAQIAQDQAHKENYDDHDAYDDEDTPLTYGQPAVSAVGIT